MAAASFAQATNAGSFLWSAGAGTLTRCTNNNSVTFRSSGGYRFFTGTGSSEAQLLTGDTAWTVLSDRNLKKDIQPVNCQAMLAELSHVPVV